MKENVLGCKSLFYDKNNVQREKRDPTKLESCEVKATDVIL